MPLTGLLLASLVWSAAPAAAEPSVPLSTQAYALPAPPAGSHLDFSAEHLDYDRDRELIHLKGDVRVKESTWTLQGDELWIDTARHRGRSEGFLFIDDGASAVSGSAGDFDFVDHTGELFNASAGYGDWRVHAKSMVLDEKRRLYYTKADFTSCSYVPPHYHFHASAVTVVPEKYLFARNVVFMLGKLPLFYTPLLYKSLVKTHFLRFKIQPGYDHRNGAFLKTTLTTQHSDFWRSKLFLDYYSSQGFGAGGELFRRKGEDSRGALSIYNINETGGRSDRWSLNGDLYQGFASSFSIQGRLQALSDPSFNNDYARSSLFPITPNLMNSGALVYRLPQATMRLSYSREDDAISTNTFTKTQEDTPRLDVQSAQLKFFGLPWLNTLSGYADNNFSLARGFTQKSVNGAWEGTRVFALTRRLSFTPRVSYSETFSDWSSVSYASATSTMFHNSSVGRYTTAGTLRLRTLAGDLDVTETYTRRLQPDSVSVDAAAVDHGVEANLLSALQAFRPNRVVLVRVQSGYDFRVFQDHTLGFRDRVQPITTDISLTPRSAFNLALRDDYQLAQGNRNLVFNGTWGDELGAFLTAGAGYNKTEVAQYYMNTELGWANSTGTLHVAGALRSVVSSPGGVGGLRGYYIFDKEVSLVRRWHDFYTKLTCRFRPGNVKEASIRIEMKFGGFDADRQKVHDWESEWFPERAQGREDRP